MSSRPPLPRPAARTAHRACAALALLALPAAAHAQSGAGHVPPTLDALVAAERAFARQSETQGAQAAFLAHFATDGVVLRERIAPARLYFATTPTPGVLTWAPAWGAVSASGDLGFTSGPYLHRASAADSAGATGQYASVWARQPDGQWKTIADVGATGPATVAPAAATFAARTLEAPAALPRGGASSAAVAEGQRAMLLIADRGLAAAGRADGPATALPRVATADVRALWPGVAPVVGRDTVAARLRARSAAAPGTVYEWRTLEARVARAGDLGVTWGTYAVRTADGGLAEEGSYLRVWTREQGGWRVLLDAANPAR